MQKPTLNYNKINNPGSGKYDLIASAKLKELIDYYKINSLSVFMSNWEEWSRNIPKRNAYDFHNAYRCKLVENGCLIQIWKHYMGSDKDPVLVYEIREEVTNG